MSNDEWWQIRAFINKHSAFAIHRQMCFKRCKVRNLNTGRAIETIRLASIGEPNSWSVDEARQYFALQPLTAVAEFKEKKEVFNLHKLAKSFNWRIY